MIVRLLLLLFCRTALLLKSDQVLALYKIWDELGRFFACVFVADFTTKVAKTTRAIAFNRSRSICALEPI